MLGRKHARSTVRLSLKQQTKLTQCVDVSLIWGVCIITADCCPSVRFLPFIPVLQVYAQTVQIHTQSNTSNASLSLKTEDQTPDRHHLNHKVHHSSSWCLKLFLRHRRHFYNVISLISHLCTSANHTTVCAYKFTFLPSIWCFFLDLYACEGKKTVIEHVNFVIHVSALWETPRSVSFRGLNLWFTSDHETGYRAEPRKAATMNPLISYWSRKEKKLATSLRTE